MSRLAIPFGCALFLAALAAAPESAWANHKSWLMKGTGTSCTFAEPNPGIDGYYEGLFNSSPSYRYMTCPLALSSRWGSSTPSVALPLWAGAHSALIYVANGSPGSTFPCTVAATLNSGSISYSRTVWTTAGGDQRLTIASAGDWGGSLETNESQTVRSMDFTCSVPGYSGVYGYKVRICQKLSSGVDCGPQSGDGEAQTKGAEKYNNVQVSGFECVGWYPGLERGHFGIKNNGPDFAEVRCPITPAADDTDESDRTFSGITVFSKGIQDPANNYLNCQLNWSSRPAGGSGDHIVHWSPPFIHDDIFNEKVMLTSAPVGLDVASQVWCELPPGATLQGLITTMGVAPVNGGG